ncbi:MAG: O-antigen ligase family protein [Bacteroidetes bacterium]|nr:O-antigen ligase family protein [Bacteroidota bacterium]
MIQGKVLPIRNIAWVYAISILFIAVNALCISQEWYYFMVVPFVLIVLAFGIFALDRLLLLTVFMVPLSIPLLELIPGVEFDMYLPTEPLLAGILILFIAKLLFDRSFDRKIVFHPVSIMIYLNVLWIFVTCITSTMPLVSFKFFIARLWFLASFYFLATQLFRNQKNMMRFSWLYVLPLLIVIGYTLVRHFQFGLYNQEVANFVPNPFYSDHTSYGAVLAMFFPVFFGFGLMRTYKPHIRIIIWTITATLLFAIVLSYTRATWVSLIASLVFFILVLLGLRFRGVLILLGLAVIAFLYFRSDIMMNLKQNRQASSADISEHIQSISNITSDDSNMERLNRWYCAFRMFNERPVFGWGPGTYMFTYAPFQFSYEKTLISTNAGDLGNAHSEYIGPLAESGLLGSVTFLLIVFSSLYTGMKVFRKTRKRELKILSIVTLLGLVTYFIHGTMNNFLDTDKASAPFWGFIAILVALDVYHLNAENNTDKQTDVPVSGKEKQ